MRSKPVLSRSSNLVTWPALILVLVLCVLAAFFGQGRLAAVLMFLFLLALASRCWAALALRRVYVSASSQSSGVFPGDTIRVDIEVQNGKFLPLIWLELFFPLSPDLCMLPEEHWREPDESEKSALMKRGYSAKLVGEKRLSFLLWYETVGFSMSWSASRRGVYSTDGWRVRTGDGFGLTQVEQPLSERRVCQFYIYPKLVKVRPDIFLRNLWNADTGAKGTMEDITVIRSTRDYQTADSLKHINWRLAARCQPLTVNVYEDILPRSVHFLFDGESFSGPKPHLEELEDALSVLASLLVRLSALQVRCGLSLCRGATGVSNYFFAETEEMLRALAAYQPLPPQKDEDGNITVQATIFDEAAIFEAARSVGRFYYIVWDASALGKKALPHSLGSAGITLITVAESKPQAGEFEVVPLSSLKEGEKHA